MRNTTLAYYLDFVFDVLSSPYSKMATNDECSLTWVSAEPECVFRKGPKFNVERALCVQHSQSLAWTRELRASQGRLWLALFLSPA